MKRGIAEGVKASIMSLDRIGDIVPLSPGILCDTIDAVAATAAIDAQMALIDAIAKGASLSSILADIKAQAESIKPAPKLTTNVRGAE